jgi:iron(III) transport system permease protein
VHLESLDALEESSVDFYASIRSAYWMSREAFVRVALPAARPAVIAGSVLVALEVLTDVGTVRLFNVQTLTDGVFRVWFDLGQREGATELASLLLLAAVAILLAERRATSRRGESGGPAGTGHSSRLVPASPGRGARRTGRQRTQENRRARNRASR